MSACLAVVNPFAGNGCSTSAGEAPKRCSVSPNYPHPCFGNDKTSLCLKCMLIMQIINWAGAWGFVFMPGLELITVSSYVLSLTYDKQRWGAERDIFQYITLSSLPSPFPITGGWINDTRILLYSPTTATRWQNSTAQQRLQQSALLEDFLGNLCNTYSLRSEACVRTRTGHTQSHKQLKVLFHWQSRPGC